jgi:hypothetical protein
MSVLQRLNPFWWIAVELRELRAVVRQGVDQLIAIHQEFRKMQVTAQQAQQNLDTFVATFNDFAPQAIALLNKLAQANASGNQLDPNKVQQDIDALTSTLQGLRDAVTNDTPVEPTDPGTGSGTGTTVGDGSTQVPDPNSGAGTGVTPGVEGGAAVDPNTGLPLTGSIAASNPKAVDDAQAAQDGGVDTNGKPFSST